MLFLIMILEENFPGWRWACLDFHWSLGAVHQEGKGVYVGGAKGNKGHMG